MKAFGIRIWCKNFYRLDALPDAYYNMLFSSSTRDRHARRSENNNKCVVVHNDLGRKNRTTGYNCRFSATSLALRVIFSVSQLWNIFSSFTEPFNHGLSCNHWGRQDPHAPPLASFVHETERDVRTQMYQTPAKAGGQLAANSRQLTRVNTLPSSRIL